MLTEAATKYLKAGLSAVPCDLKAKRPVGKSWKQYQTRRPEPGELEYTDAVCIICGEVSGNLEVIDFDDGGSQFGPWLAQVEQEIADKLFVEQSPSGGFHVFYRCSEIEGNQKLARAEDGRELIETRGEGGLIVCHPSPGYEVISGTLDGVQEVTPAERQRMLEIAKSLNRKEEGAVINQSGYVPMGDATTPWGDYNARGDFRQVLERAGWQKVRDAVPGDDNERWRRPDKQDDHSATINGDRVFYCWTSNGSPFENDKGYSPFEVYKLIEHRGDFAAALAAVKEMGYGDHYESHWETVANQLMSSPVVHEEESDYEQLPDTLLNAPGLIGDVVKYHYETAIFKQPNLAMATAITLMAVITGRKIRDQRDGRTNILSLLLAPTGGGKEHGRKVIRKILRQAGAPQMIGAENLMSASSILSEITSSPAIILVLDEVQSLVRAISNRNAGRHMTMIPELVKMAYSSADNEAWTPAAYADRNKRIVINQPHLVLMATGVIDGFWGSVDEELITSGFLGRVLCFEGDDGVEAIETPWREPSESIVAQAKAWVDFQPGGNLDDENPQPLLVEYSPAAAERIFGHIKKIVRKAEKDDTIPRALWSRSGQKACQLALCFAASRHGPFAGLRVEKEDADRAILLANWSTRLMITRATGSDSSEWSRLTDRVLTRIPRRWCSKSEVTRAIYRVCNRSQRDQILADLLEAGKVETRETAPNGRKQIEFRKVHA